MPLSEEELRLLEQMERALVEEDPKFASTLRGTSLRHRAKRRAAVAGLAFAAGVAVLMTGAVAQQTYVGIAGFVVMLASAYIGLSALRGSTTAATPSATHHPSGFTVHDGGRRERRSRRPKHSFMERVEERWRRRRDQGGF